MLESAQHQVAFRRSCWEWGRLICLLWIRLYHYLDDLLIVIRSSQELVEHQNLVLEVLSKFGRLVNKQGRKLSPSQSMKYFGVVFNTRKSQVVFPNCKISQMKICKRRVMGTALMSMRDRIVLVGIFTAPIPVVTWARWHIRVFQFAFLSRWYGLSMDQRIFVGILDITSVPLSERASQPRRWDN